MKRKNEVDPILVAKNLKQLELSRAKSALKKREDRKAAKVNTVVSLKKDRKKRPPPVVQKINDLEWILDAVESDTDNDAFQFVWREETDADGNTKWIRRLAELPVLNVAGNVGSANYFTALNAAVDVDDMVLGLSVDGEPFIGFPAVQVIGFSALV